MVEATSREASSPVFVDLEGLIESLTIPSGKFCGVFETIEEEIETVLNAGEVPMRMRAFISRGRSEWRRVEGRVKVRQGVTGLWKIDLSRVQGPPPWREVFSGLDVDRLTLEEKLESVARERGLTLKPRRKPPGAKGKAEAKKLLRHEWQARRARGETLKTNAQVRALLAWLEHHHPEIKRPQRPAFKTVGEWIRKEFL